MNRPALDATIPRDPMRAFEHYELLARRVVDGFLIGLHRTPCKGFAIEFDQHRPYVAGDDPKHIDWKVLAKLNRVAVKQYEEDASLRGWIIVDRSGSMGYGPPGRTKLDAARFIAGVFAYMLVQQRDAVGLATCDQQLADYLAPRATRDHLHRILASLGDTQPDQPTSLAPVLHNLADRIKRRGLIVLISDLFDDAEAIRVALTHFAHRRHEIVVFRVLDRREVEFPFKSPTRFDALEDDRSLPTDPLRIRRAYLDRFRAHEAELRRTCHELRIDLVDVFTDEPTSKVLARYFASRSRR